MIIVVVVVVVVVIVSVFHRLNGEARCPPQRLSSKKTATGFKFGSGDRFSEIKEVRKKDDTGKVLSGGTSLLPSPGPGEYTV